eukprot:TRINITY_DN57208_c0_g1_i1.p1 TRINITY_DN57208_c0_g1~~TRINITY_DN57208_c0_g1_i1.p1  ORF type:complete len:144 (+),score=25.21 TRINITY_DN57208_c0_g1_i1:46-477(+)
MLDKFARWWRWVLKPGRVSPFSAPEEVAGELVIHEVARKGLISTTTSDPPRSGRPSDVVVNFDGRPLEFGDTAELTNLGCGPLQQSAEDERAEEIPQGTDSERLLRAFLRQVSDDDDKMKEMTTVILNRRREFAMLTHQHDLE